MTKDRLYGKIHGEQVMRIGNRWVIGDLKHHRRPTSEEMNIIKLKTAEGALRELNFELGHISDTAVSLTLDVVLSLLQEVAKNMGWEYANAE